MKVVGGTEHARRAPGRPVVSRATTPLIGVITMTITIFNL